MNAEEHLVKARRMMGGIAKLDPAEDAIALIDATMIAGFHLGNALLHECNASDPHTHWNTPAKLEIGLDAVPANVREAYALFADLESLRSRFVRDSARPDAATAREAAEKLEGLARYCGIE